MLMNYYFYILVFFCLLIILMSNMSFLMFLISLEFFIMINLMILMLMEFESNQWMFIYYLIFSVCEAVIGLSIMVSMVNFFGNESFMKLNLSC